MGTKSFVWLGAIVGSTIGGLIPFLWNGGPLSFVFVSALGGILGIWGGFKISQ